MYFGQIFEYVNNEKWCYDVWIFCRLGDLPYRVILSMTRYLPFRRKASVVL